MEAQPLHEFFCNLPLANIPTLTISDQNHIALVTAGGVCLFRPYSKGEHRDFDKCLEKFTIPCTKEWQVNAIQRKLIHHLNSFPVDIQQQLCLDQSLIPQNRPYHPNFHRQLRWAHQCVDFAPLFALLSQDHELFIYQQNGVRWIAITNIGQLLYAQLNPRVSQNLVALKLDPIKRLVYSVLIDCIEWTPFRPLGQHKNGHECHLITATKDGIFHFWRVVYSDGTFSIGYGHQVVPKDSSPIRAMQVHKNLLFISYRDGRLALLQLLDMLKHEDGEEMTPFQVWPRDDGIQIGSLTAFDVKGKDGAVGILFCKGNHTILCEVLVNEDDVKLINETVSQGPYALELDSICQFADDSFLSSSKDGTFSLIKINSVGEIAHEKVANLGMANLSPHGLVSTRNGFLFCTASSVCAYYDHLVMRDATRVNLFTFLTPRQTTEKLRELFSTDTKVEQSFSNHLDFFNVMCLYVSKGEIRSEDFNFCLQDDQLDGNQDKLRLQIRRFVALILDIWLKVPTISTEEQEKLLHVRFACERQLVKLHAQKIISQHPVGRRRTLTDVQQKSLQQLDLFNKDKPSKLLCSICSKSVTFDRVLNGFCTDKHQTLRCPFSLLFCETPYESCNFCRSSIFIYPTIWPQPRKLCLFCI